RQQEIKYFAYYGYPIYWGGNGLWGEGLYPAGLMSANSKRDPQPNAVAAKAYSIAQNDDPHLRSWEKVKGYKVKGADED
ncbi:hypothetical protein, partial [Sanguibacter sp. 26GB23]